MGLSPWPQERVLAVSILSKAIASLHSSKLLLYLLILWWISHWTNIFEAHPTCQWYITPSAYLS